MAAPKVAFPADSFFTRILAVVDNAYRLPSCEYEHPEFGECGKIATVTDLESERPMCASHFYSVAAFQAVPR